MKELNLLPWPGKVNYSQTGSLRLSGQLIWKGQRTPRLEAAAARWQHYLNNAGAELTQVNSDERLALRIDCQHRAPVNPPIAMDERYKLQVDDSAIYLKAATEWGILRGLTTLSQLCADQELLPHLVIEDQPRFPWRGLMLDTARHFLPAELLLKTLERMAYFKLNVLHLHLSDDQGFRFPSVAYPRLPSPAHYSAAELTDLVTKASSLGIRVVPELDIPGHVSSWVTAYPAWGALPDEQVTTSNRFGVHAACLDPTKPEVFAALEKLFDELSAIFPDEYIHIGGDEVHADWWKRAPQVQAYCRERGLESETALQAEFMQRASELLEQRGKRPLFWDEAIDPALADSGLVQSWRGATARNRALAAGSDCIVSDGYYLDLMYPADTHYRYDPEAPEAQLLKLEDELLLDSRFTHVAEGMRWTHQWRELPAPELTDAPTRKSRGQPRVLGGEACLWSELVDARVLDFRLWTRLPAIAERLWSPSTVNDDADYYRRFFDQQRLLAATGLLELRKDQAEFMRRAGISDDALWLVDWLEPVKWYGRLLGERALAARLAGKEMPESRPYQTTTALDRVVDGLFPESLANRVLALAWNAGDAAALRDASQQWVRAAALTGLPDEIQPLATGLQQLGEWVQAKLNDRPLPPDLSDQLDALVKPRGEYLLAPAILLVDWLKADEHA